MDKTKDLFKKAKKNLFGSSSSKSKDASTQTLITSPPDCFLSSSKASCFNKPQQQQQQSTFRDTNPFTTTMYSAPSSSTSKQDYNPSRETRNPFMTTEWKGSTQGSY